jgi:hypothetical protein
VFSGRLSSAYLRVQIGSWRKALELVLGNSRSSGFLPAPKVGSAYYSFREGLQLGVNGEPRCCGWCWNDEVKLPIVSRRPVLDRNNELPTSWDLGAALLETSVSFSASRGCDYSISLAAVSQACRDTIDREVDTLHHPLVRVPAAVALQKLDLHVVKRIEIREAVPD